MGEGAKFVREFIGGSEEGEDQNGAFSSGAAGFGPAAG